MIARAQAGLARLHSGTVEVHAVVRTPIPIKRNATLDVSEVPLSRLRLASWAKHPRPLACAHELECARADVDVRAALRALSPLLPSLPLDPAKIRSAQVDVGVAKTSGMPRFLRVQGNYEPGGFVPGTYPFDVRIEFR